jgi:hypothetical protein
MVIVVAAASVVVVVVVVSSSSSSSSCCCCDMTNINIKAYHKLVKEFINNQKLKERVNNTI